MSVQDLLDSGAIRIFDSRGQSNVTLANLPNFETATDDPDRLATIGALELLYRSATFRAVLNQATPSEALWIDLDQNSAGVAYLGNPIDVPSLNLGGFVTAPFDDSFGMIDAFGNVAGLSRARNLAHEINHALTGERDTTEDLQGSVVNPDYKGPTVDFENEVVSELLALGIGLGPQLTSYHSVEKLDELAAPAGLDGEDRTSWTDGQRVDLVLLNNPDTTGVLGVTTGPGLNVNTSNNSVRLDDLIIARDVIGENVFSIDHSVSSGLGNDFIYTFSGKDTIEGGAGNDYVDAGTGNDLVYGDVGNDTLNGGEDNSGNDVDTLTYERLTSGVRVTMLQEASGSAPVLFSASAEDNAEPFADTFANFENYLLTNFDDTWEIDAATIEALNGSEIDALGQAENGGDVLEVAPDADGAVIDLQKGTVKFGDFEFEARNFEDVISSNSADTIDGSDRGGLETGANQIFARDGGDTVNGKIGHDVLAGGLGGDTLLGDVGADFIFDRGADGFQDIAGGETDEQYFDRQFAYDPLGNDSLNGGLGADILVASGGIDTLDGGLGHDIYLVAPGAQTSNSPGDAATVQLSGNFGFDTVAGNGAGISQVRFNGLNISDISVRYEFTEEQVDEQSSVFQTFFLSLLGIPGFNLGTYPVFGLTGSVEIIDNTTGSSLYVETVGGAYVGGNNTQGGNIYVPPVIAAPFDLVFDDGTITNWANLIEQTNGVSFVSTALRDTADDAAAAFAAERASDAQVAFNEVTGDDLANNLTGTEVADLMTGLEGADVLLAMGGNDILVGGIGGDTLDGGAGFDEADYSGSSAAIQIFLSSGSVSGGDAEGDTLISIEDIRGSEFNDTINGDNDVTGNIFYGLGGDDRLVTGFGDMDSFLYGGSGDDELIVRNGNSHLEGGTGDDYLSGAFVGEHVDLMYGGSGNDTLAVTEGNDLYDGGIGFDVLDNSSSGGTFDTNTVNLRDGFAFGQTGGTSNPGIGVNQLISIEGYLGGRGDDTVTGTDGGNILEGGRGDDIIFGLDGDDTIDGGFNDDVLEGGAGNDLLNGGALGGNDTIRGGLGADTAVFDGAFADYSFSTQNEVLFVSDSGGDTDQIENDVESVTFSDGSYTWTELSGIAQNENPVANPDAFNLIEGQTIPVDLLINDTDGNGDSLIVSNIDGLEYTPGANSSRFYGSGLTLRISSTGEVSFEADDPFDGDLLPGETREYILPYTVSDGVGGLDTSSVTITVIGKDEPNTAPVAVADSASVAEDGTILIDVIANDTDVDGDALTVTDVTGAANGVAVIEGGQVRYTPDADFNGSETMSYTVSDGNGGTDTGTVSITVTPVNDAPIAVDDSVTLTQDTSILVDVFANDIDVDGDTLLFSGFGFASNGSIGIDGTQILYTPNAGFVGTDSTTYTVTDNNGGEDTATVFFTVEPSNAAPVAVADAVSVDENGTVLIDALLNDTDADGNTLTLTGVAGAVNGTAVLEAGQVRYTPDTGFSGSETLSYTVSDGNGGSDTGTISVTVNQVNDAPTAVADAASVAEDGTVLIDVLVNDTDPDGDTLTLTDVTGAANGTATLEGGQIRYTPDADFNGSETLTYTISDGNGGSDTGTVALTIDAVNDNPATSDDTVELAGNSVLIDVLANDSDVDGDSLSIASVGTPSNGTAIIQGGAILYTVTSGPETLIDTGFEGDTGGFTYADDAFRGTNQPGFASGNSGAGVGQTGGGLSVALGGIDNTAITNGMSGGWSTSFTMTAAGAVILDFSYRLNADIGYENDEYSEVLVALDGALTGLSGNDYITRITGGGDSGWVTVSLDLGTLTAGQHDLTLGGFNNKKTFNTEDTIVSFDNVTLTTDAGSGTPAPDSFTYTIDDGNGGSDTATVSLTLPVPNSAPVGVADAASVAEDGTVLIDVLANDTDVDGDTLTLTDVTGATNGTAVIEGGQVRYTPNANFNGTETLSYTVSDGEGGSDTGTITVTVDAVNDAPVASADSVSVDQDGTILIDVLANDTDIDGDTLTLTDVTGATNGAAVAEGGQVRYTPDAGFAGSETLTYTINDGNGGSDTGTVSVTVDAVNTVPVATDDTAVLVGNSVLIDVLANDSDADGDALSITSVGTPSNGSAVIQGSSILYTVTSGPETLIDTGFEGDTGGFTYADDAFRSTSQPGYASGNSGTGVGQSGGGLSVALGGIDNVVVSNGMSGGWSTSFTMAAAGAATLDFSYRLNADIGYENDEYSEVLVSLDGALAGLSGNDYVTRITGGGDSGWVTVSLDLGTLAAGQHDLTLGGFNNKKTFNTEDTVVSFDNVTLTADSGSGTPTPDSFTYTINDGNGGSDTATVTLTLPGANAAPVAVSDVSSVSEDGTVLIDVVANDTDADGDALTLATVSGAANGAAVIEGGQVRYTPNADFNGTETMSYTVVDGNGGSDTGTVTVTIDAVNDVPVANADAAAIVQNGTVLIDVLTNDTDIDGDALTLTNVTGATNGAAIIEAGQIRYTPDPGFTGSETLSYTISDGNGGSDTATITLTVDPTPFAAIDDNATTTVGTPILIDVLANDTDGTGPYTLVSVADPANGSVEIQGNSVLYTPDTGGGQSTPVDAGFDTDADQFIFADDLFRSTNQPGFASGGYQASGGQTGGGVEVVLGGLNDTNITNGMSGGWSYDFTVANAGDATLSFAYNLDAAPGYENDEFSEILFSLDGSLIGLGGNDYITQIAGGGASGWQTAVLDLGALSAGTHTLSFGTYNNKKTYNDEVTTARFDDIDLAIASGMDFTGQDSFDYVASDTLGNQDIGTVFVDVEEPFLV